MPTLAPVAGRGKYGEQRESASVVSVFAEECVLPWTHECQGPESRKPMGPHLDWLLRRRFVDHYANVAPARSRSKKSGRLRRFVGNLRYR